MINIKNWQDFGKLPEAATGGVFLKKVFLKISQNSQENTCARVRAATLLKKTVAQVFSCEFCEIFKSTFFTEYIWAPASKLLTN